VFLSHNIFVDFFITAIKLLIMHSLGYFKSPNLNLWAIWVWKPCFRSWHFTGCKSSVFIIH